LLVWEAVGLTQRYSAREFSTVRAEVFRWLKTYVHSGI